MTDSAAGLKYQKCKLSWMNGMFAGIRFELASAYAGDPEAAKIMRTEIKERFGGEIAKSRVTGFQAPKARKALEKIFSNKNAKHLQMLIGIRFYSGELCLFKTSGKKVLEVTTEYIGSGDSSALRYLSDFLLPHFIPSIFQAHVLGSYLVSVANEYVDGCSGGPDIYTIAQDGMKNDSSGGVFPNEKARFEYCESEAGRALRELLFSGGTKALEVVNPKPDPKP
ncbi:MAG: hypothetical protein WB919_00455 [Candidatus Sulfotelmatobacter sp.]